MIITNPKRDDGFGAQYQNVLFTALYSELTNNQFVYTPFEKMEHNYDEDPSFLDNKEAFINLKESKYKHNNEKNINTIDNSEIYNLVESNIDACLETDTLKYFRKRLTSYNPYSKDILNIAVHIRIFNSHDSREYSKSDPSKCEKAIKEIVKTVNSTNYKIHIYSQGEERNFHRFKTPNTIFHLNKSIEDTFSGFLHSDILLIASSSLSYTAGLLADSNTNVYYFPFWHKCPENWIPIED